MSFKDRWINYLVKGILIFVAIIITVLNRKEILPFYGSSFDFKNISLSQIYSYTIFLYTLVAGIIPIILSTKKYLGKFSAFLIKNDLNKTFNEINNIKSKLIKEYEIIEEIWLNDNERIYIIIDELDRLNASQIVNFFDALQMFIDLEKISFVFSIDYKTVCCAIAENHLYQIEEGSISNKIKFGMKYLEKYVNVPFHLNLKFETSRYTYSILTRNHQDEKDIDSNDSEITQFDIIDTDTFNGADNRQDSQFTFTDSEINTINNILSQHSLNPREAKLILGILVVAKNIHYQINIEKLDINVTDSLTIFEDFIRWFCFNFYYPEEELYLQSLLVNSSRLGTEAMIANIIIKEKIDKKPELKYINYSLVRNLKLRDISEFSSISKLFIFSYENIE